MYVVCIMYEKFCLKIQQYIKSYKMLDKLIEKILKKH